MENFNYHRPATVNAAAALLKKAKGGNFMSGGMTLLPTMKQGLASPSDIIDLAASRAFPASPSANAVVIKAGTTHQDVATSAAVKKAIPALAELAGNIGGVHVRHRGTIGGSIANNDPAADYPSACLGLGATVVTNKRKIPADDFFTGMFQTALKDDEIVTAVRFPVPKKSGHMKFPNPASRYAMVGVFVAQGARRHSARRGDRRRPQGVPGAGNGNGAGQELCGLGRCRNFASRPRASTATCTPPPNTAPISSASWRAGRWKRRSKIHTARRTRGLSLAGFLLPRGIMTALPTSIDETAVLLKANGYVAGRDLATVVFLALNMGRPLFLEGEAGVGKTEIAKVLAEGLGRKLIRLQCYEGSTSIRPSMSGTIRPR